MLLVLAVVLCAASVLAVPPQGRVVNGTDTDISLWPYMVSVRVEHSHLCGGTAISPFWVLTAAHCVNSNNTWRFSIRYSSTHLLYGVDDYVIQAAELITHPNYNRPNREIHDIALVRLERPMNLNTFAILPNQFDDVAQDSPAKLLGWGYDMTGGTYQTTLQEVDLIVFSDEECARRHSDGIPHQSNICGGVPEGGKGQCSGDSGGPLVWRGVEVGLASWSIHPCTIYPYPGVYTQVSYYREWIRQRTGV